MEGEDTITGTTVATGLAEEQVSGVPREGREKAVMSMANSPVSSSSTSTTWADGSDHDVSGEKVS